jgi:hypothetical protein
MEIDIFYIILVILGEACLRTNLGHNLFWNRWNITIGSKLEIYANT